MTESPFLTEEQAVDVVKRLQSPQGMTMVEMAAYGWSDETWRGIFTGIQVAGLRMVLDREHRIVRFTDDEMERLRALERKKAQFRAILGDAHKQPWGGSG